MSFVTLLHYMHQKSTRGKIFLWCHVSYKQPQDPKVLFHIFIKLNFSFLLWTFPLLYNVIWGWEMTQHSPEKWMDAIIWKLHSKVFTLNSQFNSTSAALKASICPLHNNSDLCYSCPENRDKVSQQLSAVCWAPLLRIVHFQLKAACKVRLSDSCEVAISPAMTAPVRVKTRGLKKKHVIPG